MGSKIEYGDRIIIEKGERYECVRVKKGRKVCVDKLYFFLDNAVGCYYNTMFEVRNSNLHKLSYAEMTDNKSEPVILDGVNNSTLADNPSSQKLSRNDIEAYKKKGVCGMDLVEKLVENSSTFDTKTEFSRSKYITKKFRKYSRRVTIRWPTARILCQKYWNHAPNKICHIRHDTLAQLLIMADVKANSKLVVVESCQGLITAAAMERMGGEGTIIHMHAGDLPTTPYSILNCNFSQAQLDTILTLSLRQLKAFESEINTTTKIKIDLQGTDAEETLEDESIDDEMTSSPKSDDEDIIKQKLADKENRIEMERQAKRHLLSRNLDGLIVVTKFDPLPILKSLIQYIAPSRPFVVYCFLKEPLAECFVYLQECQLAINIQLTETWLREYQVLSNRTHPLTMMSGTGGYLLTGVKIDSGYDVKDSILSRDDQPIDCETTNVNMVPLFNVNDKSYSVDDCTLTKKRNISKECSTNQEVKKQKSEDTSS